MSFTSSAIRLHVLAALADSIRWRDETPGLAKLRRRDAFELMRLLPLQRLPIGR